MQWEIFIAELLKGPALQFEGYLTDGDPRPSHELLNTERILKIFQIGSEI